MSNTITHEEGNFSTIPNQLLNDQYVSLTAKGLYVFMRGKPPLWNFTIRSMAKQLKEGETAIGSALNELKDSGWISYTKHSNGKGVYHLFWSANSNIDNPNQGNPNQGYPMKGKPQRISKKEPIVKQIAKEPLSSKPDIAEKVIQYLNDKTGSKFRATPSHTKFIDARIAEGATPQDLIAVINRKCLEWLDDPKFSQYLRPSTLFNATKFNDYVGQLDTPLPAKGSQRQGHPDIDFNSTGWLRS